MASTTSKFDSLLKYKNPNLVSTLQQLQQSSALKAKGAGKKDKAKEKALQQSKVDRDQDYLNSILPPL